MPVFFNSDLPCSTFKTLVIDYTTSSLLPSDGYTVQWRAVGSDIWFTENNKKANPISIPGVPNCYPLEVRLLADCGSGLTVVETFGVSSGTADACYTHILLDDASYTYMPCDGRTDLITIYNISGSPQTICAVEGSVVGGSFTRQQICP